MRKCLFCQVQRFFKQKNVAFQTSRLDKKKFYCMLDFFCEPCYNEVVVLDGLSDYHIVSIIYRISD